MADDLLSAVLRKLEPEQPKVESRRLAAISVMILGSAEPKTLLIKRAERSGDPWSGQVAFPGGKMAEGDSSARQTAVRETMEELEVNLAEDADFAGYHRPFRTHTGDMDVVPVVFLLRRKVNVVPNLEVSGYRWVGLNEFLLPRSASTYLFKAGDASRDMPAFVLGDYVVWGLTHRILSSLLSDASL